MSEFYVDKTKKKDLLIIEALIFLTNTGMSPLFLFTALCLASQMFTANFFDHLLQEPHLT